MAWEQRGNKTYYYRSVRVGTRVTNEYVGRGRLASLIAQLDGIEREQRSQRRDDLEINRQRWVALESPLLKLDDVTDLFVSAAMTMAGYHRHDRGEWRRRRGQ
jgi:hypothetical protein